VETFVYEWNLTIPLPQFKPKQLQTKMKKVLSIVAVAGVAMLASCGNAEKLKQYADSILKDSMMKDSMAKVDAANRIADSLRQDSMNKAAAMQRVKDSLMQDSIAKSGKKGK
jgi:hypothetical protein